jgi:hypothetical protein
VSCGGGSNAGWCDPLDRNFAEKPVTFVPSRVHFSILARHLAPDTPRRNTKRRSACPFLGKLLVASLAKLPGKIAIALCLAGVTAANAAETVPIKRASPEMFRPIIVRDALEAADLICLASCKHLSGVTRWIGVPKWGIRLNWPRLCLSGLVGQLARNYSCLHRWMSSCICPTKACWSS